MMFTSVSTTPFQETIAYTPVLSDVITSVAGYEKYEAVIGLEVHVQLNTHTKLFTYSSTRFGDSPNTNTDPVTFGLPGVLPVLNATALKYAIQIGLALECHIAEEIEFSRKQYFYPDLPKGYQISQFDKPSCLAGTMTLSNGRTIRITRAHLEEDAGKLVHVGADGLAGSLYSLVDLNRAGTPLVEIVSEPDIRDAEEAREYLTKLRSIVRYLGVCDGNLEEGSMRCDANVSVRLKGTTAFGTKTEVKNMNSFRAVQRAIDAEIARQIELIESGGTVKQESRLWHEATQSTQLMRSKEEAHDYRYFPEPDLPVYRMAPAYIQSLKDALPELPHQRVARLQQAPYHLSEYDAEVFTEFKELGDFLDATYATGKLHTPARVKLAVNWMMGDATAWLKQEKKTFDTSSMTPTNLADLVALQDEQVISSAGAKQLLVKLLEEGGKAGFEAQHWVETLQLAQISDEATLKAFILEVMASSPKNVEEYRAGKTKLQGFFAGQVMKATQGRANPVVLNQLLPSLLQG
ncbi:MAG: Asp-tRNA(Asn)/Glu-tRNA(Gln) amidotransferase subunit GatB [Vampirovibrionales bacterium]